jgi:hypothetical protein
MWLITNIERVRWVGAFITSMYYVYYVLSFDFSGKTGAPSRRKIHGLVSRTELGAVVIQAKPTEPPLPKVTADWAMAQPSKVDPAPNVMAVPARIEPLT